MSLAQPIMEVEQPGPQLDEVGGPGVVIAGDQGEVEPGGQGPVMEGQLQGVQGAGALVGQPEDLQVGVQPIEQGDDDREKDKVSHGGG